MPRNGYTFIVDKLLRHENIRVTLDCKVDRSASRDFSHVFYSGPIDGWFNYSEGRLAYRTLDFIAERYPGDFQGNPVMNYCDMSAPWTRISEHKHFSPWESHEATIIFKEYSRECDAADTPYYPVRLVADKSLLARYVDLSRQEENTTFVGRLGTYRYLDMHVAIAEALDAADRYLEYLNGSGSLMTFLSDPLQ
jgi:UDP-galactopyranose mutase